MKIGIVGLGVVGTANKKGFESLPRGVSYDWETKTYQANIMDSKNFI